MAVVPSTLPALRLAVKSDIEDRFSNFKGLHEIADPSRLRLLGIGDSWFDYPKKGDLLMLARTDILAQLGSMGSNHPLILSTAHYGDASVQEMGLAKTQRLYNILEQHSVFDAILLSVGGNDVAGDGFIMWINPADSVGGDPTKAVNLHALSDAFGVIQVAIMRLVDIRNKFLPGVPILLHAYDFAPPNGQGVCMIGPWLKPSLNFLGWNDYQQNVGIVKDCLSHLAAFYQMIAENQSLNIKFVNTQGVLTSESQWDNELHPTPDGFNLIAQVWLKTLQDLFPGRV